MNKFLSIALAATLLAASCQKTEVIGTTTNGPAMTFSTEMKKITKADNLAPEADAVGDANLQAQGIKLWAYADFTEEQLANTTNVKKELAQGDPADMQFIYDEMYDLAINHNGTSWSPTKDYYWPGTDKFLRFFAISALDNSKKDNENKHTVTVVNGLKEDTNPSITIENFVVTDGNEDLMVADFRKQHQGQHSREVKLDFHHTLTKVEFKFKTTVPTNATTEEIPNVFVQKLQVTGLNYKGSLYASSKTAPVAPAEPEEVNFVIPSDPTSETAEVLPVSFDWTPTTDTKPFVAEGEPFFEEEDTCPNTMTDVSGNENVPVPSENVLLLSTTATPAVTWLMLPHENIVDDDKLIEITYLIVTGDDCRQFVTKFPLCGNNKGTAEAPVYAISKWDVNQYITYTIDLSPNMISFDATTNPWVEDSNGKIDMNN